MVRLGDLTPKEILHIPDHRQRWYETASSKTPIDRHEFQIAVETIYRILGLESPNFHFCRNPHELIEKSQGFFQRPHHCEDGAVFASQIMAKIHELHVDFVCTIGGYESLLGDQLSVISEEEFEAEHKIYDEYQKIFFNRSRVDSPPLAA